MSPEAQAAQPQTNAVRQSSLRPETEKRQRLYKGDVDKFEIFPGETPTGWVYQWVTETVMGQPDDATQLMMKQQGWTPVPGTRHPRFFLKMPLKGEQIRVGGQILMERPQELQDEARAEEAMTALGQKNAKIEELQGVVQGKGFEFRPDLSKVGTGKPVPMQVADDDEA